MTAVGRCLLRTRLALFWARAEPKDDEQLNVLGIDRSHGF